MHCIPLLSVLYLGLSLDVVQAQYSSAPILDLGYAIYQGVFNETSNTTDFLGVRYAAPPVGKSKSPMKCVH